MITVRIKKSKFMPDDYSAYLSFPFNQDVIDTIKELKHRSWIKGSKEWEIRIEDLPHMFETFPNMDFDVSGRYVELSPTTNFNLDNFSFKTDCYKHQKEGFKYGLMHNRWLLGDDQGLGKTKQVIDIAVARKLAFGYSHCLIICGVNGLKWNWMNEIKRHSDETGYILGQRVRKKTGELYIGTSKDKLHDIEHLDEIDSYFIITNVETLRDDDINSQIIKWLHSDTDCKINMIAADEVHKMKNPSSQQGKAFIKLDADCRIAMTGTPLMNSPLDLYIILRWLGFEKHAFYTFKNYYAVFGGYGGYQIVGYKHLDELEEQLQSIMLRRLKKNVLDLPEKTYIDEYVDMTAKQSVIYKEIKAEIKSNIDMISVSPNPLAEMIRLRQATGYTGILSSQVQESAKLDRMMEIVADAISNGNKVVIFSNWSQIVDITYDRLYDKQYGIMRITGDTADSQRQGIVDAFQNTDMCRVLIGTTGAMGTGLTLTAASVVIFLDHPWNKANYDQCVDRCHRIGQNKNITIYNLLAKNTIDERVWELVKHKGELSDQIVDKAGKVMTNKDIAEYLLS
jgi:SNF2 family DNA or RNA helicase